MPHKRITPRNERHAKQLGYKYAWEMRNRDKPEYRQKRRQRQRAWTAKNPTYRQMWRAKLRKEALSILGDRCSSAQCSWINPDSSRRCADERCLQIDHINGGGRREFMALGSGDAVYRRVIANKGEGYQLLCANCNWIKRNENKEWSALKDRGAPFLSTS